MQCPTEKHKRQLQAARDYPEALRLANLAGLTLCKHSDVHYQLIGPNVAWRLDIYPSNQRLYRAKGCGWCPFLELPKPWRLVDVVKAASALEVKHD